MQPIEAAPRDGTVIQARIPGHGDDNIIAWRNDFVDEDCNDCGGWVFMGDQEPPDCWTDGVCWGSNEYGAPSVQPTHWRHFERPTEKDHDIRANADDIRQ